MRRLLIVVMVTVAPGVAMAQTWQDATANCIGTTAEWTNKVEVADVDGDGKVDLLLANGGDYSSPGNPPNNEPTRIFKNTWGGTTNCTEISATALGGFTGMSRMIKAADIDGDGDLDLLTGGAYQTQLKLYKRDAASWTDATAQLPQQLTSIGDAEFGDVDNDGDLDIVLADWGGTNPGTNTGGRTRLYLNNAGTFTEATATQMPDLLVKWSWDIELADVDNDWDLDVLVSCKRCTTSYVFKNDGTGHFTDDPNALPHFTNNYEFEPMDIDKDGDLDLITINDGPQVTEHIFVNRGDGTFADETSMRLTGTANPANADDNVAVWLDYDDDGDPDLLIGTLGADRLLSNDGSGKFTLVANATPNDTNATLGLAVADFDGDGRIDILQGQGEVAFPDKVQLASMAVKVDTTPPIVRVATSLSGNILTARVNDLVGPSHVHDFQKVVVVVGSTEIPMQWYGEMLWRAAIPTEAMSATYQVCATDRQGNKGCATNAPTGDADAGVGDDGGTKPPGGGGGGCCEASGDQRGALVLIALVAITWRRRSPRVARRTSRAA
ncbi:MAG TPA: VCBS repeat-containing protein [Kofleriaceae bacterium]|nr:VCBS repeat-containing protein [Kofleriaceae bacterium]